MRRETSFDELTESEPRRCNKIIPGSFCGLQHTRQNALLAGSYDVLPDTLVSDSRRYPLPTPHPATRRLQRLDSGGGIAV